MTTTEDDLVQPYDPAAAIRVVHDHADRLFSWRYERERPQLVNLYNKAAASQWNSVTDLDWATDVDPERVIQDEAPALRLARVAATRPGSPMANWGEKEFTVLGVELFKAQRPDITGADDVALVIQGARAGRENQRAARGDRRVRVRGGLEQAVRTDQFHGHGRNPSGC